MRAATSADIPVIITWFETPHAAPFLRKPSAEQVQASLEDQRKALCIVEDGNEPVGYLKLSDIGDGSQIIKLSIVLIAQQRHGYGSFAVRWAQQFAFSKCAAHRLWLEVTTDNVAARRLYETCGFVHEGTWRDGFPADDGTFRDLAAYGMLASEFLRLPLGASVIGAAESGTVLIVDYDPTWPHRFEEERERIANAMGKVAQRIEHIGSTAVLQLAAKPIIDIMVTVGDIRHEDDYRFPLESAGYHLRVVEPGHRMFRSKSHDVQVHVWQARSEDESRHLLLRDWLRQDSGDRELYEQTKRSLAAQDWTDRNHYAEAKTPIINSILERARRAT